MLKTLRITSLIALIAAVGGVVVIGVFGLRGDSDILAFLETPGVVDKAKEKLQPEADKKDVESPLATQSRLLALRLDPPPPPAPKDPVEPKDPPKETATRQPPKPRDPVPPRPKTQVNAKFKLLATVMCDANPTRSMALLEQSGGKQEWFWQGERVGHLDIDEVRNGSVIFSQAGRSKQELFVPAKPPVKSLLKGEGTAGVSIPNRPDSINVTMGAGAGTGPIKPQTTSAAGTAATARPPAATTESGRVRIQRSQSEAERRAVADRLRQRTAPKPPTREEQKASIESNIAGIQEIMSRDTGGDPEQRKKENESWMKLLKALEGEKGTLDKAVKAEEAADKKGQPDKDAGAKTEPEKKK